MRFLVLVVLAGCGSGTSAPSNPGYHTGTWQSDTGNGAAVLIIPTPDLCGPCETVGEFTEKIFVMNRSGSVISSELPDCPVGCSGAYTSQSDGFVLTLTHLGQTRYTARFR